MELYQANHQWATRPADEKFRTLESMYDATKAYAAQARTREVEWNALRVEAQGDDLFVTRGAEPAKLTHYSFGQLSSRVGAPASYLRLLPPTLAAQNLNHGLKEKSDSSAAQLLFHQNGGLVLRAATSEKYERIWNYEVLARLIELAQSRDLEPARQTMNWSGEPMTPEQIAAAQRSLYASDHDMFAFLMSSQTVVTDPTGSALRRGIITVNSEVGDKRLSIMGFLFRDVCANHIIWGAQEIASIDLVHVGKIRERWLDATVRVRRYLDGAASFDEARFIQTMAKIAGSKDDVLDVLFGKKIGTRKLLAASYDAVVPEQDGDPNTVWGFAQGMTRHSQTLPYADERTEIDRAAGKLLALTF